MKIISLLSLVMAAPLFGEVLPDAVIAPFADVPARIDGANGPAKAMEPLAPEFKDCRNAAALLEKLEVRLTPQQQEWLEKNRFLLLPVEYTALGEDPPEEADAEWAYTTDEMLGAFAALAYNPVEMRKPEETKLVTPDLVLHAWHCSFIRTLEYCEQRTMHAMLERFLSGMRENLQTMRKASPEHGKSVIARNEARIAAAWVLLGRAHDPGEDGFNPENKGKTPVKGYDEDVASRLKKASAGLPTEIAALLKEEIALVLAHEGMKPSRLFSSIHPDKPQDYTQFKPRSHYAKNNILGGYFRAMMYLGRNGFPLDGDDGLRDALVLTNAMARKSSAGTTPATSWRRIMEVTGFFAGESDDITYNQMRQWVRADAAEAALSITDALSGDFRKALAGRLAQLPPPRVNSAANMNLVVAKAPENPEFRIFGQRFTWDTQIMQWLTNGAPVKMPGMPTVYYVPAAFGDAFAEKLSLAHFGQFGDAGDAYAAEFKARLPIIRQDLNAIPDADWFRSLGSKQLHVLTRLAGPRGPNFPHFMQGEAFAAKNIASMAGSYTELKHDTVLYAKQLYAEGGEGGEEDSKLPPAPRGFVQPDPVFWREMERMAVFAAAGFASHKLIPDAAEEFSRYQQFARDIAFLRKLADAEVAGADISKDDWERLRCLDLNYMASPVLPQDTPKPGDGKVALVTDIATDMTTSKILMEALGRPYVMLAIVGGRDGTRLTAGLAYNHHEFTRTLDEGRMTDAEWQEGFYTTTPKSLPKPAWHPLVAKPVRVKKADE